MPGQDYGVCGKKSFVGPERLGYPLPVLPSITQIIPKFDEQIQLVNALNTPLANIKYALLLTDGSTVKGVTEGKAEHNV